MTWEVVRGDCLDLMLNTESVDAIVTDPPYGLHFMGKTWDSFGGPLGLDHQRTTERSGCMHAGQYDYSRNPEFQRFMYRFATEALRVLKPGGHLLIFGGTRTHHRLMCAIEDAGWEIRDCLMWVYGSGFSKSWNFKTQYKGGFCACGDGGKPLPYNHGKEAPEHDLRSLRETNLSPSQHAGTQSRQVLLPLLSEQDLSVDRAARPQPETPRQQQSSLEGRQLHRTGEGLPDDSYAVASTRSGERLCTGTHPGGRADVGTSIETEGGSTPPKPQQDRQSTAEPSHLQQPSRPLGDGTPDGGSCCPRCGLLKSEYKGFGTGLKPAYEIIILARKPLIGTVAANVLEHGTGGLNIDATRIGTETRNYKGSGAQPHKLNAHGPGDTGIGYMDGSGKDNEYTATGRWPANVVHDGSEEVVGLFPHVGSTRVGNANNPKHGANHNPTSYGLADGKETHDYRDSGSAARFFYCAKASRSEREAGLEGAPQRPGGMRSENSAQHITRRDGGDPSPTTNHHPTVKPVALMRWLCRLVTPPDGLILDPFCGSGSTGVAASLEGFRFIGIEVEAEYCEIARKRIAAATEQTDLKLWE